MRLLIWRLFTTRLRVLLLQELSNFKELSNTSLTFSSHSSFLIISLSALQVFTSQADKKTPKKTTNHHKNKTKQKQPPPKHRSFLLAAGDSAESHVKPGFYILQDLPDKSNHFCFILNGFMGLPLSSRYDLVSYFKALAGSQGIISLRLSTTPINVIASL